MRQSDIRHHWSFRCIQNADAKKEPSSSQVNEQQSQEFLVLVSSEEEKKIDLNKHILGWKDHEYWEMQRLKNIIFWHYNRWLNRIVCKTTTNSSTSNMICEYEKNWNKLKKIKLKTFWLFDYYYFKLFHGFWILDFVFFNVKWYIIIGIIILVAWIYWIIEKEKK